MALQNHPLKQRPAGAAAAGSERRFAGTATCAKYNFRAPATMLEEKSPSKESFRCTTHAQAPIQGPLNLVKTHSRPKPRDHNTTKPKTLFRSLWHPAA